jgi:predicted kinase
LPERIFRGLSLPRTRRQKDQRTAAANRLEHDVQQLTPAVDLPARKPRRPTLIATVGLPGSGKSYFARELAARLPLVHLESDALRAVLFRKPRHRYKESRRLFQAIHALAARLLTDGYLVLLDATNLKEDHRRDLKQLAASTGSRLILVELTAPEGVALQRLKGRELRPEQAGIEVYLRMREEAEPILLQHRSVDSAKDITSAIEAIAGEIESR